MGESLDGEGDSRLCVNIDRGCVDWRRLRRLCGNFGSAARDQWQHLGIKLYLVGRYKEKFILTLVGWIAV